MACSKIFGRRSYSHLPVLSRGGNNNSSKILRAHQHPLLPHHQQSQSIHHQGSNNKKDFRLKRYYNSTVLALNKFKDTVLLLEATKGPLAKVGAGVCQTCATAAVVFGVGSAFATLFTKENVHSTRLIDVYHDHDGNLLGMKNVREYLGERDRRAEKKVNLTYFHMGSSLLAAGVTSLLSFRIFKNKALLVQIGNRPLVAVGVGVVTPFIMASIVRNLPRTENDGKSPIHFGIKEFGHLLYSGTLGLVAAPLYLLGGQSMLRAAYVTAGCMAGMHGVAKVAPTNAFINWEGPLIVGMNAVLLSFLLTLFLRRTHYAFMPLYRFMMHGGLVIYSLHYVHSLQKMEATSVSSFYDPVNAAMTLSMSILNIFGRLAFMLPPYWQVCRDHFVTVPAGLRREVTTHPMKTGKPGGSTGGEGGNGNNLS